MHKGEIACEEKQENELASVDVVLSEVPNSEKKKIEHLKLEALVMSIEDIENCLEGLFRPLI